MKHSVRSLAEFSANTYAAKITCLSIIRVFNVFGKVWGFFRFRALVTVPPLSSCHWSVSFKYPENICIQGRIMISADCVFGALAPIKIGTEVRISQGVHIETASLDLNSSLPYKHIAKPITIGNGVWIGAHAFILGGVSIGDGAVIGAGVIVSKDVPPAAIIIGHGARLIERKSDYKNEYFIR
jgi:maltose O-acetyltransferase